MRGIVLFVVAIAVAISVLGTSGPTSASGMNVGYECNEDGAVGGTITGVLGPYPVTFDVFVTEHLPGQGGPWPEVTGSRQTVTATGDSVGYGPLDISQVRAGVKSIRVEQTLSSAKSESFKPCEPAPTPSPTPEPTPTPTPEPTPPPTLEPTPEPAPSPTLVPVASSWQAPPDEVPSALPVTGAESSTTEENGVFGESWFWVAVGPLLALISFAHFVWPRPFRRR